MVRDGKLFIAAFAAAAALAANAEVELAGAFSDGAVLQRGMKVPVWGTSEPGEKVAVSFAGQSVEAVAGADGAWRVDLAPMEACSKGRTLTAKGDRSDKAAKAEDILVGEVWFCSGQSNTELPLVGGSPRFRDGKGAMRAQMTVKPLIRYCYQSDYRASANPKKTFPRKPEWKKFLPENLGKSPSFSAMGVYFALELHSALGVPVGIIGAYWGGTGVSSWTPASGNLSVEATRKYAEREVFSSDAFAALPAEKRPCKRVQDQPRVLWNEMVAPWTPYAIRGFIWYQGCNNVGDGPAYAPKMHALYNGWAKEFENPDLRLRFVQLAPWGDGRIAALQMAQELFAAEEPNAKMAVINDLGNLSDIHPNDKETVGQRLALLSLKYDYGFERLKADSPTVKSVRAEEGKVVVEFDNAESLYIYNPDKSLTAGLEICGEDGEWKSAVIKNLKGDKGLVDGAKLVVQAEGVAAPKKIRYLHSRPWFGCIYNEVNLPLGAFEKDLP